jgi:hypothetical protein
MTEKPDIDTLYNKIASELPNPSWAQAALSDLAARARDKEVAERETRWALDQQEAAEALVAELEAARDKTLGLLRVINYEEGSLIDRAVEALAGDGGGA